MNDSTGKPAIAEDKKMGPATMAAVADLAGNPATRQALLNAIANQRLTATEGKESDRINYFRRPR